MSYATQQATKTVKRYRLSLALKVLVPSAVLAPILAVAIVLFSTPKTTLQHPHDWGKTPSFSAGDQAELVKIFNASLAVTRHSHLRRLELAPTLNWLEEGYFNNIRSQADLKQSLSQLVIESKDSYAAVMTVQEYRDLTAREGGAVIGVKLKYSHESKVNAWVVSDVPKDSSAERAGVEKGDIIVNVDGIDATTLKSSSNVDTILNSGFVGSRVPVTLRRGTGWFEVELEREVTSVSSPTSLHSGHSEMGGMTGVKVLDVNNLHHQDVAKEVEANLKEVTTNDKEQNVGLVLDLQGASSSNAETAARVAAMFIEKGVICHYIRPTGERDLEICRWEVQGGKVLHIVKGPYAVSADGKIDVKQPVAERTEVLNWPTNLYKQYVVVVVGSTTSGGGEIIAAAIKANNPRALLIAQFLTAGKGMAQTYVPAGNGLMLRLTTSYFLAPDGSDIEGVRIRPNVGIHRSFNLEESALELMGTMLNKVARPQLPDK